MTAGLMRAVRWHGRGDVRIDSVPVPAVRSGEALIAVERAGICGTDLEEYLDGPVDIPVSSVHPGSGQMAPLTLGHEVVGRVADCPGGELPVGTRVVPDVVVGCGRCWWCQRHQPGLCPLLAVRGLQADGALAEYLLTDAATCVPISDDLAVERAVFAEPVAVAVRAFRKVGDATAAAVAVVGLGTIGNLVAQVALGSSARAVIGVDPSASRRKTAAQRPGFRAVPSAEAASASLNALTGRLADIVVECAGTQESVSAAISLARPGGTVVLVGTGAMNLLVPVRDVVLREKRILGTAAHVWDEDVAAAVALLRRGVVNPSPLVSRVIGMDQVVDLGLEALSKDPGLIKILVVPSRAHPREPSSLSALLNTPPKAGVPKKIA